MKSQSAFCGIATLFSICMLAGCNSPRLTLPTNTVDVVVYKDRTDANAAQPCQFDPGDVQSTLALTLRGVDSGGRIGTQSEPGISQVSWQAPPVLPITITAQMSPASAYEFALTDQAVVTTAADLPAHFVILPLIGFGVFQLLAPDAAWSLHAQSKREEGITSMERTEEWDTIRFVGGAGCIGLGIVTLIVILTVLR